MKTIKEINKPKFKIYRNVAVLGEHYRDVTKEVHDFYTQQILSLIEELEGKKKL